MFRKTDPQTSLLESRFLVPPAKRARLENSWAHVFNTRVLPLIDEEIFRAAFVDDNGRPNKSIRLLTGLHLLKEWNDLTDEQVLENLEYNLQWQYALGVTAEEAHTCQKTLHNHRVRMMEVDGARRMMDRITTRLAELDGVSWSRQRLDSTHVMSNIEVLTRLGLFVETVTRFLKELRRDAPGKLGRIERDIVRRYLEREGYFSDARREQARRRLPVVARDLLILVMQFEGDTDVGEWESYQLMVRLLDEQCEVHRDDDPDTGTRRGTVRVRAPKELTGASLQSPHDPDATYGHKGKGYEFQIAETCVEDNPYQLVTHGALNGANESDQHATLPVIGQLRDKGLLPDEMVADTAYGSGENIVAAAVEGVKLLAPVQDPKAPPRKDPCWDSGPAESETAEPSWVDMAEEPEPKPLGLADFVFGETYDEVRACPEGHAPREHRVLDSLPPYRAVFDASHCQGCPMAQRCPAREVAKSGDRILRWRDVKAATATRQREQQEAAFKERYRIRSGIESAAAEVKGLHGAASLRVRRRERVETAMLLKTTAMNVKRAVKYHLGLLTRPSEPSGEAILAGV